MLRNIKGSPAVCHVQTLGIIGYTQLQTRCVFVWTFLCRPEIACVAVICKGADGHYFPGLNYALALHFEVLSRAHLSQDREGNGKNKGPRKYRIV